MSSPVSDGARPPLDDSFAIYERKGGWAALDLRELWRYHELLYFLTWRDILVRYNQAVAPWAHSATSVTDLDGA